MSKKLILKPGSEAPGFSATDSEGNEIKLSDFEGEKNVVLKFLRYYGCPLCQMSMAFLRNRYDEFTDRDAEVIVFVQSPQQTLEKQGMADAFPFHVIPDPDEKYYNLYGVGSGNIFDIINGKVIAKAIRATVRGHMQGKMEGNSMQLPGDFIVGKDGKLILARLGEDVGDTLDVDELLSYL